MTTRRGSRLVAESPARSGVHVDHDEGLPRALNLTLGLAVLTFRDGCVTLALLAVALPAEAIATTPIRLALWWKRMGSCGRTDGICSDLADRLAAAGC